MTRLIKYLYIFFSSGENAPEDEKRHFQFGLFSVAGICISLFLLVYKEVFTNDLANPVAETATLLVFVLAFYLFIRNKTDKALNLVFLIPLLVYLYYLADFSENTPPEDSIYFTLAWLVSGLIILAWFSKVTYKYTVFFVSGLITMAFHTYHAGNTDQYLSLNQTLLLNPFIILIIVFITIVLIRNSFDWEIHRVREEEQFRKQQMRDLFQQTKQPLALINAVRDQDGNIIRLNVEKINRAFESVFKISFQEAQNQELNYLFNYVFRNETNWNDLMIIHPKQQTDFYSSVHERWFNLHFLWPDPDTCICLFYETTQEKKTILNLEETRAKYLALLEAIPDIFFVIDSDGTFEDVVFKGQENMYLETSNLIGKTIFDVGFSEILAQKIGQCIKKTIENDTIESIEYTLDVKGNSLLFEMRLARLNDHSVISIARDITFRKRAEFELERAKTKAEEATALKSRFLANLSEDIRTPMGIIMSLTKMLTEPDLSENEKEQFIQDVQHQGNILLNMIENTIYLSRIETNTLNTSFSYTNIHLLLRRLYQFFSLQLSEIDDVKLFLENGILHEEVGFETDPVLLYEIISRLLENALKFTAKGSVHFGYLTNSNNTVRFFVKDTGQGIPETERENIFLRFYVIEEDRKAKKSGLGLGLPIAQHFVALLGGELQLDSVPGKGSRFWFDLPLKNSKGFMKIIQ